MQQSRLIFPSADLKGLIAFINERRPSNIIVMVGAGASVAAGIPDFRTPGVGLYSKVAKTYPALADKPELLFSIEALRADPSMFYSVAKDMNLWPDSYAPTDVHKLIKMLQDKKVLKRCYTQNIDTLERSAGVSADLIVEAHGSFAGAHCIDCKLACDPKHIADIAKKGEVPRCDVCNGIIKPDVVFFGEALPERFFRLFKEDLGSCDLLLVIGTSLQVYPFALLVSEVHPTCPRVLINMNRCGPFAKEDENDPEEANGEMDSKPLKRDLFIGGDCQEAARALLTANFGSAATKGSEETPDITKEEREASKKAEMALLTKDL